MTDTNQIPPGTYIARATRWHWDTSKNGDMCLAVMLRIEDGPHAAREVRGTLYFDTEKTDSKGRTAADRSIEALRAMGLQGGLDTIDSGAGGLDAGQVSVVVEINDKGYAFAKYINALSIFSAFAPPAADAKRAFFAQMNARLKNADAAARASGTQAPRPAPRPAPTGFAQPPRGFAAEAADDDIPF